MSYRFADSSRMTYNIAACTVKNSWWWTGELSETRRVLFQKWIWEISASSWFYFKSPYTYLTIGEKFKPQKDVVQLQYENVYPKGRADVDNDVRISAVLL